MKFNAETIAAFARLVSTLLINMAAVFSWNINEDLVVNVIISALGVLMMGVTWWRNNNITEAAQEAQLLLDELKSNEKKEGKHAKVQ